MTVEPRGAQTAPDALLDDELRAVTRLAAALAGGGQGEITGVDDAHQPGSARGASIRTAVSSFRAAPTTGLAGPPQHRGCACIVGREGSGHRVEFHATVPLVIDGVQVGSLCVMDDVVRQVTPAQLAALEDLAAVAAGLLHRRRSDQLDQAAEAELVRARDELHRSRAFAQSLLEALPVGVVAADADRRVTLFNQVSRHWHGQESDAGLVPGDLPTAYDLFESDGETPLVVDRVPLLRVFTEGRVSDAEIVIHPHGTRPRTVSCSGTQIRDGEGRLLGAVMAMADVTAQRDLERQLRAAAMHDPLTGLPNRRLLVDRLTQALRARDRAVGRLGVLYGDLDGFKAVNDTHGHAVGDEVLVEAATRLLAVVRPQDTVARIGGDEFVLLCPGLSSSTDAQRLADRVTVAMAAPLVSSAGEHQVGISIGLALSDWNSETETLLTSADRAMYEVKRARAARPVAVRN